MKISPIYWIVAVLICLYGSAFIFQSSVVVNGQRYFTLFDDALISMTYGKNLLNGYGLNWARYGKPVEGFTNTLWTFIMVPFNALPINDAYKSLGIQVLGLAFHLLMLYQLFKLFTGLNTDANKVLVAGLLVITGLYYPLIYWGLLGMETSIQSFFLMYAVRLYFQITWVPDKRSRKVSSLLIKLFTVFSFSILLRYDMVLPVLVISLFLVPYLKPHLLVFVKGVLIVLLPNLAYLVFRWFYFGDVFPNTFYLKMAGIDPWLRIQRGWMSFIHDTLPMLPLIVIVLGWVFYARRKILTVAALVALVYMFYSIYIGGDAWDFTLIKGNRFISIIMPLILFLLTSMTHILFKNISLTSKIGTIVSIPVLIIIFLCCNNLNPLKPLSADWKKISLTSPQMQAPYHKMKIEQTLDLNRVASPDDKVAVVWAGIPAFFGNFKLVDILGYNDRELAHQPVVIDTENPMEYRPGHMKWNDEYSFGVLKPDYIMELWKTDEHLLEMKYGYTAEYYPSHPETKYWKRTE